MSRRAFARRLTGITAVGALGLAMAAAGPALAAGQPATNPNTDGAATGDVDTGSVLVQLSKDPLATSTGAERSGNGKVDFNNSKTRNVRADLAKQRNELRQWLKKNAPKAKITGEYDVALNAVAIRLNGTPISVLQGGPGVVSVEYQGVYTPTAEDPDLKLINALEGWDEAGASATSTDPEEWAGAGIQVGVIDSGIDAGHACFDDTGFDDEVFARDFTPGSDLTNNKVIVAKVFNNKIKKGQYTPEAVDSHGTHVAGTIACNLETGPVTVQGAEIPYFPSGVAPGAQLGNYNVFPGDVASARSEDILNALQAAYEDGMDVINMSLGGGSSGKQDLLTIAVDNLDRAGVVVAVSAGNEGPGYMTIGSPGMAERALTAGASSVGHYVGLPITAGESTVTVGATGDFAVPASDLPALLAMVTNSDGTLSQACSPLPAGSLRTATDEAMIALISRGTCSFATKIRNAEAAGYVGAIIVNNVPGDPSAMGGDGGDMPGIPAVMAPLGALEALSEIADDDGEVTISSDAAYTLSGNDNLLMNFSSVGPTDVEFRVKPDVVAPGGNVLSSIPRSYCADEDDTLPESCWAFMSGTSMASPHLAGMAAVVRDAHPDWEAWQVRSAIINTADAEAVWQTLQADEYETNVLKVGSGLAQLDDAVNATLVLSQPSISFGGVPSGSGRSITKTIEVTNVSGNPITFTPEVIGAKVTLGTFVDAPLFSVEDVPDEGITLDHGDVVPLSVSFEASKVNGWAFTQAHLTLGEHAHAVLFAYVK